MSAHIQKITPFLWFDGNAEEAAHFYLSVFEDSKILKIARQNGGSVMTISFLLAGQSFDALNGGPDFKFNQAVSFVVNCETQLEIDLFWDKLCQGGEEVQCGWLKDKFGLYWQVVPSSIGEMLATSDPEQSKCVMQALFQMKKLDLGALERAYAGEPA